MGFVNELKKLARPYAEDEDEFDEEYEDEVEEEAEPEEKQPRASRSAKTEHAAPKQTASRPSSAGNVVNFRSSGNLQVILVKPESYENVREVADHLRNKCAVVLNLEFTNSDTARRLVDFLTGCTYALDGKIKKVATNTYIITPFNVDIVGDLKEELENSGVYL